MRLAHLHRAAAKTALPIPQAHDGRLLIAVSFRVLGLGHLYGCAGDSAKARRIFEELYQRSQRTYVPAYDLALVCVGLGWTDQAFEWLDKAHQERSGWLTYLRVEPRLDSLRMDARFGEMLHRLRLGC